MNWIELAQDGVQWRVHFYENGKWTFSVKDTLLNSE
jgi:hypothetical protein